MTNPVQEKVKADLEKAQKEGGQRLDRIRKIVKAAAVEAISELKEGSTEIESLGRKSLADMIAQLKAQEAQEATTTDPLEADTIVVEQRVETDLGEVAVPEAAADEATETKAPTWQEILAEVLNLANERKTGWAQQFLTRLQEQMDRFDGDMATEYGARYNPFRPVVRGLRGLIDLAQSRLVQPKAPTPAAPITIEVLDDEGPDHPATAE
jgi:hypothetical protein